jgi:hypothetical protein
MFVYMLEIAKDQETELSFTVAFYHNSIYSFF